MSLKYDPKSHQILTASGVNVTFDPAESIILVVGHIADVLLHTYVAPPRSSAKIQLKRKHFLEAFEVKTLLNFGCSSAFLSSSVHLILLYRINLCVCLYMEQS